MTFLGMKLWGAWGVDTKVAGLLALQNSMALLYEEDHGENVEVFLFNKDIRLSAFIVSY